MFVGLHALMAERTGVPEWNMSEDEGKQFMSSAQQVMRHYSVETTQKTLDWIAFLGTGAGIYGTRLAAYKFRKEGEKASRPQAPANVVQFNPSVPSGPPDGGFGG